MEGLEKQLTEEKALDILLARIELNAARIRQSEHPVIGAENMKLFQGAFRLLGTLQENHPIRKKYDPTASQFVDSDGRMVGAMKGSSHFWELYQSKPPGFRDGAITPSYWSYNDGNVSESTRKVLDTYLRL